MITLAAPAKINLHLNITDIRDDGMHELDTGFAYVDCCDELEISEAGELSVSCSIDELSGENNLVFQLLSAFAEAHSVKQGLHIHIRKQIPAQAGLGGGSSDAATALLAANQIWGLQRPISELIEFAAPFGADIPCFLYGRASLAHGIGEQLTDYPHQLPKQHLLLIWPGFGLSTAAVFNHYDRAVASGHLALTPHKGVDTIRDPDSELGINDLETSACSLNSKLKTLLERLRQAADRAWMSGSGSTCIALFDDAKRAEALAAAVAVEYPESWIHVGTMQAEHPLDGVYWDVAKR